MIQRGLRQAPSITCGPPSVPGHTEIAGPNTGSPLQQRLRASAQRVEEAAAQVTTLPNRISLLLDSSGSMRGSKMENLKTAVNSFTQACDFCTTSIAVESFGRSPEVSLPLVNNAGLVQLEVNQLAAEGGTPLADAMERALNNIPMTRAVIVSDGQADRPDDCEAFAGQYAKAGIPCDCVHIGESTAGEDLLKRIAELTGGIFMKFRESGNFAQAFKFLTPGFRALLTSGQVDAQAIGATEIK